MWLEMRVASSPVQNPNQSPALTRRRRPRHEDGSHARFGGRHPVWRGSLVDPIGAGIRGRIRGFIETMLEEELAAVLGRARYERRLKYCRDHSLEYQHAATHAHTDIWIQNE